jgi:ABC-type transport system involved in multi-copper enzyme maturation permease subunit
MRHAIQANLKQILFLRTAKIFLTTIVFVSVLLGALFTLTTNVTQGRTLSELTPMNIFSANMLGVDLGAILLIAFTAITIGREFSTNGIRLTLGATPHRIKFFLGKFITYLLVAGGMSFVMVGLIFGSTQFILAANDQSLLSLGDSEVWQFIVGVFLMPVFYSLMTVAATFLFGSSGGGIVFSLLVMFLPALIRMFTETIQELFLPLFPEIALHNLSGTVATQSLEYIGTTASFLVLGIWLLVTAILAILKFQRQDF